ncbi:serine/threonine protein kinase [Geopsychrobacter electrodiphilus]|uniref:serine/threonine protein kinase n=1 Tax=Geopsychrobacter electrodiphilus TaxID=225196 RepID=UPI0003635BDA|nr:serine/threonine protein kinase [Geopsychrobacter electrodiphilus]
MSHPFDGLNPDLIMDAVETLGYRCDCRIFPLNSYENRVYRVGVEDGEPLIAKFYRPERWSIKQLQEEQDFCFELQTEELPILAPLKIAGKSLHKHKGYSFSLFPLQGGYAPEFSRPDTLKALGRLVARLHNVGRRQSYKYRPTLDIVSFGHNSAEFMLDSDLIPETYRQAYESLIRDLLQAIEQKFALISSTPLRVHGDCHVGNFLERNERFYLVDFDDSRMSYAIQDLWMFLSGDANQQQRQLETLLEGYQTFADFNPAELQLIEAYRSLRIVHYAAWLARRQDDPAFQRYFPWFGTPQYWGEHILELREQYAALNEGPLEY